MAAKEDLSAELILLVGIRRIEGPEPLSTQLGRDLLGCGLPESRRKPCHCYFPWGLRSVAHNGPPYTSTDGSVDRNVDGKTKDNHPDLNNSDVARLEGWS